MEIRIIFHGNLRQLLPPARSSADTVPYRLERRASIKDIIEALGVPHPEIAALRVHGREVDFNHIAEAGDLVEVWPLTPPVDVCVATRLRPQPLAAVRFLVDVNVGKLAALLRMAGFDTLYQNDWSDIELAIISAREKRILLTRDRNLLKHRQVELGHLIREQNPGRQLIEVVRLYGLEDFLKPFSRCIRCNDLLVPVAKEAILDRLKPLTRKHYNSFRLCRRCDKVFWPGSHRQHMQSYLEELTKKEL
ncbi:MAG: hypothetical protein A2521_11530 [Deltaproteobacteria bacterium RIFOXYD12_FULL_57_12]|nr:MAG: hypothetical protein A2521_11530 [Deltaproteobacteria bacterium RIFOXYD12_FULL_57_12]